METKPSPAQTRVLCPDGKDLRPSVTAAASPVQLPSTGMHRERKSGLRRPTWTFTTQVKRKAVAIEVTRPSHSSLSSRVAGTPHGRSAASGSSSSRGSATESRQRSQEGTCCASGGVCGYMMDGSFSCGRTSLSKGGHESAHSARASSSSEHAQSPTDQRAAKDDVSGDADIPAPRRSDACSFIESSRHDKSLTARQKPLERASERGTSSV
mmetsp:Transcript_48265/g.156463  ORF Transcript_48265/g.156463 Transcript_48265/m.156463 type:complete len:211 (-) Transcript_48265:15-647(-)